MSDLSFTHLDPLGRARMVDVTPKEATHRRAVARCKVVMKPETTLAIANREVKKGDVLSVARVAGIQAAKRTADMIPLCHPLLVGSVSVNFDIGDDYVAIEAQVDAVDRTGVEMEALHACATAALTIYDMCKSVDRGMVIDELTLWEKTGGRSGVYRRTTSEPVPGPVSDGGSGTDEVGGDGAGRRADQPTGVPEGTPVVASSSANVVES
jgi:cyclic pyranopterin phosphate synthase